jgi:hypothetical protein
MTTNPTLPQPTQPSPAPTRPAAAAKPVIGTETAEVSAAEHAKTWWEQMKRQFTPPDIWTKETPPLQSSWLWAKHGQHLPEDEHARTGARGVAMVLLPFEALFLYLAWIFRNGSRVVAAAALVLVVLQIVCPIF